jgi:hypothetical protein
MARDKRNYGVGSEFDWDLGVVRFSEYNDDGFLGVQIDAYGDDDQSGAVTYELMSPFGFLSRPVDPDTDSNAVLEKGTSLLVAHDGNERHAWLSSDPRTMNLLPRLQKGASMQFASDGSFCTLDPVNRQWTCYVVLAQDPTTGLATKAVLMQAGLDANGDPAIMLAGAPTIPGGSAPRIDIIDQAINLVSPDGTQFLNITDAGVTISGKLKTTSIDSGPAGTPGAPLLKATEFLLWAAQVTAAINSLAPGSVTLPPGVPTVTTLGS